MYDFSNALDFHVPSKSTYYSYLTEYIAPVVNEHYKNVVEMTRLEVEKANTDPSDGVIENFLNRLQIKL